MPLAERRFVLAAPLTCFHPAPVILSLLRPTARLSETLQPSRSPCTLGQASSSSLLLSDQTRPSNNLDRCCPPAPSPTVSPPWPRLLSRLLLCHRLSQLGRHLQRHPHSFISLLRSLALLKISDALTEERRKLRLWEACMNTFRALQGWCVSREGVGTDTLL